MALFTASETVSPWLTTNDLLVPRELALRQGQFGIQQQNALMAQEQHQQATDANSTEYLARAAQGLLSASGGDEAKAAAAYPDAIASLPPSLRGRAPASWPGMAAIQRAAAMGTSSAEQYKTQQSGVAGAGVGAAYGFGPGASAAPGSGATDIPGTKEEVLAAIMQRESGGQNIRNRTGPGGTPESTASGYYQMIDPTWLEYAKLAGVDTAQYPTAMSAPREVQARVAGLLYDRQGQRPWAASAPRGQQANAAPVAPAGGAQQPAPYKVASLTPTAPPTPPAAAAALPDAEATKQAQATGQPVEILGGNGTWALPNGGVTSTPPAAPAPAQTVAPAQTAQAAPAQQVAPAAPAAAQMPAELQTDAHGLTARDRAELAPMYDLMAKGRLPATTFQTEAQQRVAFNAARQDKWTAQQTAARTEQRAVDKAAMEAAERAKPYQGTGMEQQDVNIVDAGDDGSRRYAGAHARLAAPKYFPDGSVVRPDMSAYDIPTFKGAAGGPDPGMSKAATTPPPAVVEGMLGNVQSVRQIDKALAELDRRKGAGVGWLAGSTPAIILNRTDPEGVALRALIADIGSLKIHDRSGAAVSASESPRLMPFIPSISDPPEAIKDKLTKFRREYQAALQDSYQVYGPKAGGKALEPVEAALKGYSDKPATAVTPDHPPLPPGFKVIQ